MNYAFKRKLTGLWFKSTNRVAITSTTETLVRQVVDRFRQQVDRTVCEDELGTTLVQGLEALASLTISPTVAVLGFGPEATFPEADDRVINGGTGSRPKGVEVHPAIAMIVTLGRDNFTHGDHLCRTISDVTDFGTPVTT